MLSASATWLVWERLQTGAEVSVCTARECFMDTEVELSTCPACRCSASCSTSGGGSKHKLPCDVWMLLHLWSTALVSNVVQYSTAKNIISTTNHVKYFPENYSKKHISWHIRYMLHNNEPTPNITSCAACDMATTICWRSEKSILREVSCTKCGWALRRI